MGEGLYKQFENNAGGLAKLPLPTNVSLFWLTHHWRPYPYTCLPRNVLDLAIDMFELYRNLFTVYRVFTLKLK